MHLSRVNIINFKNIKFADLTFCDKINCFVGNNGMGKTNFLDAIYYLSLCKSLTGISDKQIINHKEDFFVLEGDYYTPHSHNNFTCSYSKTVGKTVKRNEKKYTKISEHIGAIPLVAISPSDSSLIDESGESRRRYLNTFISQLNSSYLNALIRYNAIIAQRNQLLKDFTTPEKGEILDIFDLQLSDLAENIYAVRLDIINKLSPIVSHYYNLISNQAEEVTLQYSSQLDKTNMLDLLKQSLERDISSGYTSVGIGRDDIKMKINDYPIKRFGSQGQQKSFLIAMKLAQYDIISAATSSKPILLLDDIFDRLDSNRVSELISIVSDERFGQIFITDCDGGRIEEVLIKSTNEYKIFTINNGIVE